ncbi:MAG TPA: uracil-DNA glycosylase [Acidobacteriaceae bacterium]|nr:uracil-DNA glycosylase [Acidobacteriaceae bacterium]
MTPTPLALLNAEIAACRQCARLREHCERVALEKRRAYKEWEYWGKPVPSFGDEQARVLILGLAPGAHGSNRTGRPFTGDGSGDFLYPVLCEAGFASQPNAVSRDDGMKLRDCWITAVVRCAPPQNKPESEELANCAPFLDREIAGLPRLRVVVCLGRIAFEGYLKHLARSGRLNSAKGPASPSIPARQAGFAFFHGAEYTLPGGPTLLASFHPSLQNTNTGKLTRPMLLAIFERARALSQGGK